MAEFRRFSQIRFQLISQFPECNQPRHISIEAVKAKIGILPINDYLQKQTNW